ncbi:MAG TPA: cytochrome c [Vicinamibacterales bacterium]
MLASRRLVMLLVLSVPIAGQALQVRPHDPDWLAPVTASSKRNPLAARADARAGGGKVFRDRCSSCHGDDGRGTSQAPDLTQAAVQSQSDGALFWKISGGNAYAGMPTFSFLPEPQRWQLVLHLRELAKR